MSAAIVAVCLVRASVSVSVALLQSMKDRGIKIAFLEKTIANIESVLGEKLDVRPQKVVAGAEPENTNELLLVSFFTCVQCTACFNMADTLSPL